jgi:hypothetical protein
MSKRGREELNSMSWVGVRERVKVLMVSRVMFVMMFFPSLLI